MMNTVKLPAKIHVTRFVDARNSKKKGTHRVDPLIIYDWDTDHSNNINYTKYNIKESDFRIKTANFTSPDYLDLTQGVTAVRISSPYHENFAGIILDVDYDPETGLYTYQCQDWSRAYMRKIELILTGKTRNVYNELISLLTHMNIDRRFSKFQGTFPKNVKKDYKKILSGLRPLWKYDQSLYKGNKYSGNPMKQKPQLIIRDKTEIEAIRDLVYGSLGFFDVYFNEYGVIQIEPLSKSDWESTGLHLTTGAALKEKYKFSTTNAISRVYVNGSGTTLGKGYGSDELLSGQLDLSAFFGVVSTSISDPTSKDKNTSNATKTNSKKTTTSTKDNPYGTKKKEVWITIDNIFGQSQDRKIMNDFASAVQKAGWTTHVGEVGPSYHYAHAPGYMWAGKVVNAVWFVIYGGACAGTLNEAATPGNWYRKPLADRGSRTVVGFIHPPCGDIRKGGKYYSWLPRAHDDNFSPSGFTGLKNPGQFLTNKGIPWMYAKDGKALADKFLQGGDNPEACNKSWIP